MTRFYRWLESMGQDPRTFWRDAVVAVIRYLAALFIALLPITLLSLILPRVLPVLPVAPAPTVTAPGAPSPNPPPPPWFWAIMAPFGIYMVCAISAMISYLGHWYTLAKMFPAPPRFADGKLFRGQSASVGISNYNNVLNIRVSPQGLYLACFFPFSFMHSPILLPWSQITALREKRFLGRPSYFLTVGTPKMVTIALNNPKIIEAARQWLPETSPPP